MARDNIKEIIERGSRIPAPKSFITTPSKKEVKVDRKEIAEQPKMRHEVKAHRTMRGTRK